MHFVQWPDKNTSSSIIIINDIYYHMLYLSRNTTTPGAQNNSKSLINRTNQHTYTDTPLYTHTHTQSTHIYSHTHNIIAERDEFSWPEWKINTQGS